MKRQRYLDLEWAPEWPQDVGTYLFYGDFKGASWEPRLHLCKVRRAGSGGLMYGVGSHFLSPREEIGLFARIEIEEPDVSALSLEAHATARPWES